MASAQDPPREGHPAITLLLLAGAVALASYRNLQAYIAAASLTPPNASDAEHTGDTKPTASTPVTLARPMPSLPPRWRRIVTAIATSVLALALYAIVLFVIPYLAPQIFVDGLFSLALFFGGFLFFFVTLCAIYPPAGATFTLVHTKNLSAPLRLAVSNNEAFWMKLIRNLSSYGLAALLFVGAYHRSPWVETVVAPVFALSYLLGMRPPRLSMRMLTCFIVGCWVLTVGFVSIICLALDKVDDDKNDSRDDSKPADDFFSNLKLPADWIMEMIPPIQLAITYIFGAVLTTVNLRYDYARAHPFPPRLAPGEAATIPTAVAPFKRPMFNATFLPLLLPVVICMGNVPGNATAIACCGVAAAAPLMVGLSALRAYLCGEFKDWWTYQETWVPKIASPEEGAPTLENVESINEEKHPLPSATTAA